MKVRELKFFINDGFGWVCKKCSDAADSDLLSGDKSNPRLLFEGEAESQNPRFSNAAMAKWSDLTKQILCCPICEIEEKVQ